MQQNNACVLQERAAEGRESREVAKQFGVEPSPPLVCTSQARMYYTLTTAVP